MNQAEARSNVAETLIAFLGAVQLAIGKAGVVIDHADHDSLAGVAGLVPLTTLTGCPVPRMENFGTLEGIDVKQRAPASVHS